MGDVGLIASALTEVVKSAILQSLQSKYRHLLSRPSVITATCPWFVFPILKTRLLSFGSKCSCRYKSGRTPGPVDADVRMDSLPLCALAGLISGGSVFSLQLAPPESYQPGSGAASYKSLAAKHPQRPYSTCGGIRTDEVLEMNKYFTVVAKKKKKVMPFADFY